METITNYKIKEFLMLDNDTVEEYMMFLELLQPLDEITVSGKTIQIKQVTELLFGEVQETRMCFENPSIEGIFECIALVTGLPIEEVQELPILDFYGILPKIRIGLENIANMEVNELTDEEDDDSDILYLSVNASERMARFGILNTINHIAGNDPLKWNEIYKLPYMTVFNWLVINKTTRDIQRDVNRLQRQKQQA
jgi:hypothetical protein